MAYGPGSYGPGPKVEAKISKKHSVLSLYQSLLEECMIELCVLQKILNLFLYCTSFVVKGF